MTTIILESLTKTYPGAEKPAVKDISLEVEKGSIVTLLGPSGCGKTTILRIIAGFEKVEKGTVYLDSKAVNGKSFWVPPERRGVGIVFQDYALFPHLTAFENVGFGLKKRDRNGVVTEIMSRVEMEGYENRYPHELSGGQQQRIALARSLAKRPVVVLLDEPFSNLDADMRTHMRIEVKRIIKEAGATAVLVSHDQKDALAISDRIAVLKEGEIQQVGTPREIYQFPENKFVATFVGQTNLLKGKIGKDGRSVVTELGVIPCRHTHNHKPGDGVQTSIRPDSLELDANGPIKGLIKEIVYTGENIEAFVAADLPGGGKKDLIAHIHPEKEVDLGDTVAFKILPDFIAVVQEK